MRGDKVVGRRALLIVVKENDPLRLPHLPPLQVIATYTDDRPLAPLMMMMAAGSGVTMRTPMMTSLASSMMTAASAANGTMSNASSSMMMSPSSSSSSGVTSPSLTSPAASSTLSPVAQNLHHHHSSNNLLRHNSIYSASSSSSSMATPASLPPVLALDTIILQPLAVRLSSVGLVDGETAREYARNMSTNLYLDITDGKPELCIK